MNERIDLLALEATDRKGGLDRHKFAELIVRECIDICENVAHDAEATANSDMVTEAGRMLHQGMYGGAKSCGGVIKHHFGVES